MKSFAAEVGYSARTSVSFYSIELIKSIASRMDGE